MPDFVMMGVLDPWGSGALDVEPDGQVMLMGTGLTMVDIAIALKERGHRGTLHAVPRRGLLPQPQSLDPSAEPRTLGPSRWTRPRNS